MTEHLDQDADRRGLRAPTEGRPGRRTRRTRPARRLDDVGEDFVELPPHRRSTAKVAVVMGVAAAVMVIVGVTARSWYAGRVDPPGPPGGTVTVEVPAGTSVNGLGSVLADAGVIRSATLFRFWVRSKDVSVEAGSYRFRRSSSFAEALAVVRTGPAPPRVSKVTIPEGLTLEQIQAQLAKKVRQFSAADVSAALSDGTVRSPIAPEGTTDLEGLLFPSTYELGDGTTPATLVNRMAQQMVAELQQTGGDQGVQGAGVPKLSTYQVLIVASLVQAEAGSAEEAPRIARVIYNRLRDGEPLGIDATSKYLAERTGKPIDFASDSPYNTRRRAGLPPTPIGAPGEYALRAALRPADGPWKYYVLEAPGRHVFTASYDEFLRLKQACEAKKLGCG
ncbi:MAG: endolytic transglycosylase MltG [Actinobacteria bacterium]|nr:endolytic transglycosylase MltG [Actinomycetota bacterium]